MNNSFITTNSNQVKLKNRKVEVKSGKESISSPIELEYDNQSKNLIISFLFKGNKPEKTPDELSFYLRKTDDKNFSLFTIRNGNEIRFQIVVDGNIFLTTNYTAISKDNLFAQKFNLVLSAFEESFTVIIDGIMVMNIEHFIEQTGNFSINFLSANEKYYDFILDNFRVSESTLDFEPIIKMNKNASAYFMQANDFYEQNAYDLALYYYKKGVLYGTGDDKIYNRIGNLQFLIENYPSSEFYYKLSLDQSPDNNEYKFNHTRSLIKQNKSQEFIPVIKDFIENKLFNFELFIDYAGFLIQKKDWPEAKKILDFIKPESDNTAFNTKYGRVLVELNQIDDGKKLLYKAAFEMQQKDPSSSLILLNYSLEKKPDLESLKLMSEILINAEEYQSLKDILSTLRNELAFDDEMMLLYIKVMHANKLFNTVWQEIRNMPQEKVDSNLLLFKGEAAIELKLYDDAENIINQLYADEKFCESNINRLAILIFRLAGFTKKIPVHMKEIFEASDKNASDYVDVQKEFAKLMVDLTEYESALPILEKLLKIYPDDIELQYNTGIALDGIGDWEGARIYLNKVYNATSSPEVGFIFAHTLYYCRMFGDSLNIILKHYNSLPDDGKKDNLIGNNYLSMNNFIEAQKYYYLALEKNNDNEEYALNLAESFYKLKDYQNAYMITKQLINPSDFNRAMTLHIKLKEHLFFSINCSICNVKWEINKKSYNDENIIEIMSETTPSRLPAGTCPECGKIYCRTCAQINEVEEYICPDDKANLKENMVSHSTNKTKNRS